MRVKAALTLLEDAVGVELAVELAQTTPQPDPRRVGHQRVAVADALVQLVRARVRVRVGWG